MESVTSIPVSLPSTPDDCLQEGRVAVDMGTLQFDHTNPTLLYEFDTQGFSPQRPLTAIRSIYFDTSGLTSGAVTLSLPTLGITLQFVKGTQGFVPLLAPVLPQDIKFTGLNTGGNSTDGAFKATLYNFTVLHKVWSTV